MLKETKISQALRLVFASGAAMSIGMLAQPAFAQQADTTAAPVQRVEITGSSIKRVQAEGSVPVQTLTQEDIKRSGVTSVTDLIQNLPVMQGFTTPSVSVNGGGGGTTSAAIHSLPSRYTLVLLDGQRLAGANLESIPLDAIERVEVVTDGASATYGSDAIAGVVNFILKKNKTDGDAYATFNNPQHPGGKSMSMGISKGFGNLETDGYNVLFTYSHDLQKALAASQRDFSKQGGYFNFGYNGQTYLFNQRTGNTVPANINFKDATSGIAYTINPYYTANGNCGNDLAGVLISVTPKTRVTQCRFNYAATVQDIPETKRDSGMLRGSYKVNDTTELWGVLLMSRADVTAQFAPSAQPLGISPTQLPTLYNKYLAPYLAANNLTFQSGTGSLGFRTVSLGGRTDDWRQDTTHFSAGIDTSVGGWDLKGSMTLSKAVGKDIAAGGYSDYTALAAAVNSGAYDPVMNTGSSSLTSTLLNGTEFSRSTEDISTFKVGGQHDLFALPGGTSIISLGAELTTTHDKTSYNSLILSGSGFSTQPTSTDYPVGGNYGQVPFDSKRSNYGLTAEAFFPVAKNLEVTTSARYDHYSKTHSKYVFSNTIGSDGLQDQIADADLGNSFGAGTYKVSTKWTPTETFALRAEYGTGFRAPSMAAIASPLTYGGSTSGSYTCPFANSSNTAGCLPGIAQYDLLSGGNAASGSGGLKAENSSQWSTGFVVEPMAGLSVGADLWYVKIRHQVLSSIPEQVGFADPTTYSSLFIHPYADPAGFQTIGYIQAPLNGGVAHYKGIDWKVEEKAKTPYGKVTAQWSGTYMMKEDYTFVPGGQVLTSLGQYGPDQSVVFRVQMYAMASLANGPFTNTLSAHYKSGYQDQPYGAGDGVVSLVNADGTTTYTAIQRHVGSYTTFDWQGVYEYNKALTFTAGIKNLFDRNPPLTLQNAGGGNQVGYDGRYTDPLGRQFYLTGHYKF